MGMVGRLTPERAKMAIVISSTMQSMCHRCPNCKREKFLLKNFYVPDTDKIECQACLEAQRKKIFKDEEPNGNDTGNV